jgi:eukaryotic-like serine/threonine-protein kinase
LNSRFNERDAAFSPDGHWMAYFSDESGANEVYVRSFPDRGAKWQISNAGGSLPLWSRTTKEILFRNSEDRLMSASYTIKGDAFAPDKPRLWSNTVLTYGIPGARHYDLAPDGKRFVAVIPKAGENLDNHVVFLMNFFDELRRRVPAGK